MSKFKVGDKVKVIKPSSSNYNDCIGKNGVILKVDENFEYKYQIDNIIAWWKDDELELVEEEKKCEPCGMPYRVSSMFIDEMSSFDWETSHKLMEKYYGEWIKPYKNNKKTIMSKITTFAKNLVLSADEKLLRKYGLKNECGEFTDEAESLVMAKLVKENEAYLVELAKGMEAEEAKK